MKNLKEHGEFKIEEKDLKEIKNFFCSESLSEDETKAVIKKTYEEQKILIDPHTAIGVGVVNKISLNGKTIVLSTAHPAKFSNVVMEATGVSPELPENLKDILTKKEKYKKIPNDLEKIKQFILDEI